MLTRNSRSMILPESQCQTDTVVRRFPSFLSDFLVKISLRKEVNFSHINPSPEFYLHISVYHIHSESASVDSWTTESDG